MKVPVRYSLMESIHSWIYPDIQPAPEKTWNTSFGRLLSIEEIIFPVIISQSQSGNPLRIHWNDYRLSKKDVRDKVKHILSLDYDITPVIRILKEDQILSRYHNRLQGIRPYLADTPYEAFIKAIIQQQISYKAANVITVRLIQGLAERSEIAGKMLYGFPNMETLSRLSDEKLRGFGLGYKVAYIRNVLSLMTSRELVFDNLDNLSINEIREILMPIRGIGNWTIRVLLIAGLGDFTEFPYGDLVIRNILGFLFNDGERVSAKEVQKIAEQWGKAGSMILYLLMCGEVLGYLSDYCEPKTHKRHS